MKWPNDVVTGPSLGKLAGILVEGRPQEGWAVLGIGVNVAVRVEELPQDVRARAASLQLPSSTIEPLLVRLVEALERRLAQPGETALAAWRKLDALFGHDVTWDARHLDLPGCNDRQVARGQAAGIDDAGRLIVTLADGSTTKLDAGEVHLGHVL
jgi:BirA family biotin operon repressor/biotin-[acetyl-CoA-carboxylase] ligase